MSPRTAGLDRAVTSFRERLEEYAEAYGLTDDRVERIARSAVDFAAARELYRGETADRIGPVYGTEALAEYLVEPGRPLSTEAVRKRAKERRLVAFRSDDGHWLYPAWQFQSAGGRLVPLPEVIELWRRLPHGDWMSEANLAVWMTTRMRSLRETPVDRAHRRGPDDPELVSVVARLRARVAGHAA